MKRQHSMQHIGLRIVGVLTICLAMVSCIKDDLSDCPTTGSLELRVTFFNKTIENTFDKQVSRLDFFIFDEGGKFVSREIDATGPFTNEYSRALQLPYGTYKVVVWGNLYDDTALDGGLEVGVTTIDDLRLRLVTSETRGSTQPNETFPALKNFVRQLPTTLFYGITDYATVLTGKNTRQHVDLLKDTHDVHVTLRWKNILGYYDYSTEHQRTTRAYITGRNGEIDFHNKLFGLRDITYIPTYRDPADHDPFGSQTAGSVIPPQIINKDHVSVLPDFRTMRLMHEGSLEKLVITTLLPDGSERIVYARSIVELIRLTGQYNSQAAIDRTNDYYITVDFRCTDENHQHGSTWITATIWVNNWIVVDVETEI